MAHTITAGEAWQLLGADPRYKPSRPERAANGPMLWKLNMHEQLTLRAHSDASDDLRAPVESRIAEPA